jgi:TP901 family phage tail tape measure protein
MALGGSELGRLKIVVEADSSSVTKGFAAATLATNGFAASVEQSFSKIKGAGAELSSFWGGLSTGTKALVGFGAGAALIGTALATTIKPAIEFESAFAGVKKTVDTTPQGMERIRTGLIDLSKVMPTSAKDLAQIAENAGQLGVAAPQILKFTEVVAQLGETTDLSFDAASTELARFLNITGGGAALIEPVSNALVALGNAGASTESEIVNFSQRLASAVTVAGGSEDQILALASAFSSFGVNAEAGGSALSTIITNIADSARGGNDNLELFAKTAGLLPEQFAQIARANPVEALILFGEGLGEIVRAGGSVTPIMKDLELGGLRTSEVMRLLALNSDQVREALKLSAEEFANGNARQEEYDKRTETTASRLEVLRNRITAIQIAVGTNGLDVLARGADLAGDAIAELADILAPLAIELAELFGNGAQLAAAFWTALGGPAAKVAVGALIGVTEVVTGLLEMVNSLGPGGLAIAGLVATLAGFGPVVRPLVFVVDSLAASIYRVGTAGSVGAGGMIAFQGALQLAGSVGVVAVLAAVGKALHDAGSAAEAAGTAVEERWNKALKAGDYQDASTQIAQVTRHMEELDRIDKVSEGWGGGLTSWGNAFKSVFQILTPGTENTIVNARAELERLNKIAEENNWVDFNDRIGELSDRLGVSGTEALKLADQFGLLDQVVKGTDEEFAQARDSLVGFASAQQAAADLLGKTTGELITQIDSLPQLSEALGVTGENLLYVAENMKGLNFDDLFSDDAKIRADALNALLDEITGKWAPLADAVGLTTNEVIDQNRAIGALAGTYDVLRGAIDQTVAALNALNDPQLAFEESAKGFDEALKGVNGEMTTLVTAAQAGRQAIADFAGTAPSFDELIQKQADFAGRLYEAGIQAGYTREAVLGVVAESLRIPTGVLIEILAKADQAKEEADTVRKDLADLTEEEWDVLIDLDPELARTKLGIMKLEMTDFTEGNYTAPIGIENEEAIRKIGEAKLAATDYAAGAYQAPLTADNEDALGKTSQASDEANRFAGGTYRAPLTADDTEAREKTSGVVAGANRYAAGTYRAPLTADNTDAVAKTGVAQGEATKYGAMRPRAVLGADNKQAVGAIQEAINRLSGFQSKTVTLTVRNVTINAPVGASARGNFGDWRGAIYNTSGVKTFASGGYYGAGADYLAAVRPAGPAFYPAIPSWARVFGEPATGGEWYLPARGDRARQLAIWNDAGRKLGFLGAAGRSVQVHVTAPISIDARETGVDPSALGVELERRVSVVMERAGRELLNLR